MVKVNITLVKKVTGKSKCRPGSGAKLFRHSPAKYCGPTQLPPLLSPHFYYTLFFLVVKAYDILIQIIYVFG